MEFHLDKSGSSPFTPADDSQASPVATSGVRIFLDYAVTKSVQDKDLLGGPVMFNMLSWKPSVQIDMVMSLLTN